jgi:hypothetical protein
MGVNDGTVAAEDVKGLRGLPMQRGDVGSRALPMNQGPT